MATNTTTSSTPHPNLEREPLFMDNESNEFLFANDDSITIHSPHPLFDIQVMETYDAFLLELSKQNAKKTLHNDYDDIDVLCFKAERALSNILSVNAFEQQSIEYASSQMTDRDSFEEITDFASAWLENFINEYNVLLHDETPDAFDDLLQNAKELAASEQLSPEIITRTITAQLNADESL